jgi:hypothetical protein
VTLAYRGFGIWMPSLARVTMGCRGGGGAVVDDGSGGARVEGTAGLSAFVLTAAAMLLETTLQGRLGRTVPA